MATKMSVEILSAVQRRIKSKLAAPQIAAECGVSQRLVQEMARAMGLARRGRPPVGMTAKTREMARVAQEWRRDGQSVDDIARKLSRTRSRVFELLALDLNGKKKGAARA